MSAGEMIINRQIILPGQFSQVILASYRLPTKTTIDIPAYVFRSSEPGPVVLLLAGMHGDEINGMEIIRRMIIRNHLRQLISGTVIAIPVINIVAFLSGSRVLPDGRDLNRCFPGNSSGSLGSRIAHDLMKEVIPKIDFGIDFHTGGSSISNFPQIRCNFKDTESIRLAEQFGTHFILNSSYRDQSLRKEALKIDKNIIVYEGGESARFDEYAIEEGVAGCLRLFRENGMLDVLIPANETKKLLRSVWIRAKSSGLFHPARSYGSHVRKGERIGDVSDPYGESETRIISPTSGYIIGLNNRPVINQGDAIIHIGTE